MKKTHLERRTFLRGIGVAIGLPTLDAMLDGRGLLCGTAHAQARMPPKRLLICFCGQSLAGKSPDLLVPDTVGAGYDLKAALAPWADFDNVKNEISVVSKMRIPIGAGLAFRSSGFHSGMLAPLISGKSSLPTSDRVPGRSADQIAASVLGGGTVFNSLVYRVQAASYRFTQTHDEWLSYKADAGGNVVPIPPTVSPSAAYRSLFMGFVPVDPQQAARRDVEIAKRKTILDLVGANTARLVSRLGSGDRQRLDRHLSEIRDLERRISVIEPAAPAPGAAVCKPLAEPGADPTIGSDNAKAQTEASDTVGYSNEEARAKVLTDLMTMAFACDLTRAGSLMYTMAHCRMNSYALTGRALDVHELGHASDTPNHSKALAWHMKHFGRLVAKFRDTPEAGGNLLDNTAVVCLFEGGVDVSGGAHTTENMAALIAGRVGKLKAGRHVVAAGKHPANVLVSALRAVGIDQPLGDVSEPIPELFGS